MEVEENPSRKDFEPFAQIVLGAAVTTAFHPIGYAKILIQLGFEPLDPVSTTTLFGRSVQAYPNVFKYLGHIRQKDGFFGLYRGLGPRLLSGTIGSFVSNAVQQHIQKVHPIPPCEELEGVEPDTMEQWKKLAQDSTHEMVARCAGVIVSQPFQVIMVRTMAQFVGDETQYSNIFSSTIEIIRKDGILGFFSGLIPRLLGEIFTIWLANTLAHVFNMYLIPKEQAPKDTKNYTVSVCSMLVTQITYPFSLVSNIMAISGSGLKAESPTYSGWITCWGQLSSQNQIKRGSSLFWRYYRPAGN